MSKITPYILLIACFFSLSGSAMNAQKLIKKRVWSKLLKHNIGCYVTFKNYSLINHHTISRNHEINPPIFTIKKYKLYSTIICNNDITSDRNIALTLVAWADKKKQFRNNPNLGNKNLIDLEEQFMEPAMKLGAENYLTRVILDIRTHFNDGQKKGLAAQQIYEELLSSYELIQELINLCNKDVRTAINKILQDSKWVIDIYGCSFSEVNEATNKLINAIEENKL